MRALTSLTTRSAMSRSRSDSSSDGQELRRLADGQVAHLGDVLAADGDGERRRLQARPTAVRARHLAHVRLDLLPGPVALRRLVAPLEERDDALVGGRELALAPVAVLVLDGDVALHAVEQDVLLGLGQLPPRLVEVDAVGLGDGVEHALEVLGAGRAPGRDGALVDRQVGVGHDQLGVDLEGGAEAVAVLAGAVGRVEGEVPGRQLLVGLEPHRAGQVLGEGERLGARCGPRPRPRARARSRRRRRPASAPSPPSR